MVVIKSCHKIQWCIIFLFCFIFLCIIVCQYYGTQHITFKKKTITKSTNIQCVFCLVYTVYLLQKQKHIFCKDRFFNEKFQTIITAFPCNTMNWGNSSLFPICLFLYFVFILFAFFCFVYFCLCFLFFFILVVISNRIPYKQQIDARKKKQKLVMAIMTLLLCFCFCFIDLTYIAL